MPFGPTHSIILTLARWSVNAFYREIVVVGEENVPDDGPVIVVSNHHNMTVDPAMLSLNFPKKLHYWAKDSLFKNPWVNYILRDAGNIPVDRKNKNNQLLFAGTFDALKLGECVAIFPEGTSYTEPGIKGIKDGASWTALEYSKNLREKGSKTSDGKEPEREGRPTQPRPAVICVVGLNYVQKSKYRSSVAVEFGPPIEVEPYMEEFMTDPKSAVKKLSSKILEDMLKVTVNAPDWETWKAAQMARELLFRNDQDMPLNLYRPIAQSLIDIFSPDSVTTDRTLMTLKKRLISYHDSLSSVNLTNSQLGPLTLPKTLDPNRPIPLPTRFSTLSTLIKDTLSSLIRLPFFILPLLIHLPVYVAGRLTLVFINSEEEEAFAQNKIVLGLLLLIFIYISLFVIAWFFFFLTPVGLLIAFGLVWSLAIYHDALVDDNYDRYKKLYGAWKVLVGIWKPVAKKSVVEKAGAAGPGGMFEIDKEGEYERFEGGIRKALRLRIDCSRLLGHYFLEVETGDGGGGGGGGEGTDGKETAEGFRETRRKVRETVGLLRRAGARLGRSVSAGLSDGISDYEGGGRGGGRGGITSGSESEWEVMGGVRRRRVDNASGSTDGGSGGRVGEGQDGSLVKDE